MNKDRIVKNISDQITQRYPEFKGISPKFKWDPNNPETCILTYQTSVQTSTGKKMVRRVKVISNVDGKIEKVSSSK